MFLLAYIKCHNDISLQELQATAYCLKAVLTNFETLHTQHCHCVQAVYRDNVNVKTFEERITHRPSFGCICSLFYRQFYP